MTLTLRHDYICCSTLKKKPRKTSTISCAKRDSMSGLMRFYSAVWCLIEIVPSAAKRKEPNCWMSWNWKSTIWGCRIPLDHFWRTMKIQSRQKFPSSGKKLTKQNSNGGAANRATECLFFLLTSAAVCWISQRPWSSPFPWSMIIFQFSDNFIIRVFTFPLRNCNPLHNTLW